MTTHNINERLRGALNQPAGLGQLNDSKVLPVTQGGTEANNAPDALVNLGLTATVTEINNVCDGVIKASAVWDPASVAASGYLAADFTIAGVAVGDECLVSAGTDVLDLVVSSGVTALNTVTIVIFNPTIAAIDLVSSTWHAIIFKQ